MDLVKIGKYIAGKRKGLGLTQRQLAEKLSMSDKSVSKWERGVCLPDVSVYADLCAALGISLNEFLAGEDIEAERLVQKAEENLIGVAADGKRRQRRLMRIIALLLVLALTAACAIGVMLWRANRPRNDIGSAPQDSIEMKTAELLAGPDGAFIYEYTATDAYRGMSLYVSRYRAGELVSKEELALSYEDVGSPGRGDILIVPDFEHGVIRLIIDGDGSRLSTEIPLLEDVPDRQRYGRSATQLHERVPIRFDQEQGLLALIYDADRVRVSAIQDYESGNISSMNDYVYYFSIQFCQ